MAETVNGTFLSAEAMSSPKGSDDWKPTVPEDLGISAAKLLLQEIYNVKEIFYKKKNRRPAKI